MASSELYKECVETYQIITDEIAVGSNKNFWDIFNPTNSNYALIIYSIYCLPKTDVAVTGTLGVRFDFYRTSSAGTGGTSGTDRSVLPNVPTFVPMDTARCRELGILAGIFRSAPTGGANVLHYVGRNYIFPEETNAQTNAHQHFNLLPDTGSGMPFIIHDGEGLLCKQGSVASVNSFTFKITFGLYENNKG